MASEEARSALATKQEKQTKVRLAKPHKSDMCYREGMKGCVPAGSGSCLTSSSCISQELEHEVAVLRQKIEVDAKLAKQSAAMAARDREQVTT